MLSSVVSELLVLQWKNAQNMLNICLDKDNGLKNELRNALTKELRKFGVISDRCFWETKFMELVIEINIFLTCFGI